MRSGNYPKLLTAEKARKLTGGQPSKCEIEKINEYILAACDKGLNFVNIAGHVSGRVKTILEVNGFDVKYGSQYNEMYTIVRW